MSPFIESIVTSPMLHAVGWALVHFTWQAAVIAGVVAIAVRCTRTPGTRYWICVAGLFLTAVAPLGTAIVMYDTAPVGAMIDPALMKTAGELPWTVRIEATLPALTAMWFAGMLALQLRLLIQWIRVQRWRHHGTRPLPTKWHGLVEEVRLAVGMKRTARVLESTRALTPMVVGWFRPVVLLPTVALTGLSPEQLRAVIAHELSHVKRHDCLINMAQAVIETVLFFHPAVWWMSGRIRLEREYCCDDVAVAVAGDPIRYARALTSLDDLRTHVPEPALGSTGGPLMNRIQRIVGINAPTMRRVWVAPVLAAGAMTAGITALAFAEPPAEPMAPRTAVEVEPAIGQLLDVVLDATELGQLRVQHEPTLILAEWQPRQLDPFHADVIAALRAAGADNEIIHNVMASLGANHQPMEQLHLVQFLELAPPTELLEYVPELPEDLTRTSLRWREPAPLHLIQDGQDGVWSYTVRSVPAIIETGGEAQYRLPPAITHAPDTQLVEETLGEYRAHLQLLRRHVHDVLLQTTFDVAELHSQAVHVSHVIRQIHDHGYDHADHAETTVESEDK